MERGYKGSVKMSTSALDQMIDKFSEERWSKAIKYKFPPNNNLVYWQGFSFCRGVPSDVEFEILLTPDKSHAVCRAPGYGVKGNYGYGQIIINKGDQK